MDPGDKRRVSPRCRDRVAQVPAACLKRQAGTGATVSSMNRDCTRMNNIELRDGRGMTQRPQDLPLPRSPALTRSFTVGLGGIDHRPQHVSAEARRSQKWPVIRLLWG